MSTLAIGGAPHAFVHSPVNGATSAVTSGPYANRPAAAAASGRFYYATDMQALFMSTGAAWILIEASCPQVGAAAADVAINTVDPNFVDLVTVNAQGTGFLVHAVVTGVSDSSPITPRARVLVDGVETNYFGVYGPANSGGAGGGTQAVVQAFVTGLVQGSHAFKLQGSYNGAAGGWTVHANTNPTREGATLSVVTIASD